MQALGLTLFERIRLNQILTDTEYTSEMEDFHIQLNLFDKTLDTIVVAGFFLLMIPELHGTPLLEQIPPQRN